MNFFIPRLVVQIIPSKEYILWQIQKIPPSIFNYPGNKILGINLLLSINSDQVDQGKTYTTFKISPVESEYV